MFGYITTNQQELKIHEFITYRGYYCGICHNIKTRHGELSRFSLNYDLTFVALLLSSLDLRDPEIKEKRCLIHPLKKHKMISDDYTNYAADMSVLLAYFKCVDDWQDDHSKSAFCGQLYLKHQVKKIEKIYPDKVKIIKQNLKKINTLELSSSNDIDKLSSLFGEIMAQIMVYQNERWHAILSKIGMHLGKFIYLMDAYDDLEKDIKNNAFNPLIDYKDNPEFESWITNILSFQMAKVCEALEELPIVENVNILENILYSGVWTKYHTLQSKKEKK